MKKFIEVIKLLIPLGLILFFTNGRWVIPIAVWISTPLLLRLSRELKLLSVVLIITPLLFIVNLIIWKNIIPLPVPLYQIVSLITSIFTLIPFLIDGLLYQKTNRTLSILIFPLSFVSFHFIFSKISPSGTFGSIAYTQTNIYLLQIIYIKDNWEIIFLIILF